MELHQKLQELRKQKGLTQEQVATTLYVSRTAVSKWESGRGYPNVDSLRAIAKFYEITLDELLSSDELLTLAEADSARRGARFCDLVFGMLDVCMLLFLCLPLFAARGEGTVRAVSLLALDGVRLYLKVLYLTATVATSITGVLTLALQNTPAPLWVKHKRMLSLASGAAATLLFILGGQPYAATFAFALLAIKALTLFKSR